MNPLAGLATLAVLFGIAVQFSLHRQTYTINPESFKIGFIISNFFDRVEEGHVGVYFRGGAMLGGMAGPGETRT